MKIAKSVLMKKYVIQAAAVLCLTERRYLYITHTHILYFIHGNGKIKYKNKFQIFQKQNFRIS